MKCYQFLITSQQVSFWAFRRLFKGLTFKQILILLEFLKVEFWFNAISGVSALKYPYI